MTEPEKIAFRVLQVEWHAGLLLINKVNEEKE